MRDASLDEFVDPEPSDGNADESEADADGSGTDSEDTEVAEGTESERETTGDGATEESEETADGDAPVPEAVDPAEPTFDFAPGGADCEGCGETTRRRWRDDDAMVCADCKEW